jgi:two-component system, OmpR family, copper resistance phosphate regulon response regulator CusR
MTPNKKILLVEDEVHVVSFIRKGLSEEGYEVSVALDGNTGLRMASEGRFDVILLDIMLPGISGLEICEQIRAKDQKVPVLFLTALGTPENIVAGLEKGADDYIVKPFRFIELLARIKSLLRRSGAVENIPEQNAEIHYFADIHLNDYTKTVTRGGTVVNLTSTEYRLLMLFLKNPGRVLSRTDILEEVWGINYNMGTNVVDVYVNYLRKKLDAAGPGKLIHTVIGMGYVLKKDDES